MADLGKLRWVIDADDTQFNRKMNGMRRNLLGTKALLASLAVAGAAGAASNAAAAPLDRLAKVSRVTGTSVGELQRLNFAAKSQGVEGGLNQYLAFNRRLGKFQETGKGSLGEGLRAAGASSALMASLRGSKSTRQAFGLLSNAVRGAKTTGQAAAFSEAAGFGDFGSSFLGLGNKGIQQAGSQLRLVASDETAFRAERLENAKLAATTSLSNAYSENTGAVTDTMIFLGEVFTRDINRIFSDQPRELP